MGFLSCVECIGQAAFNFCGYSVDQDNIAIMSAARADPELWARVKASVQRGSRYGPAGTWNARKAQFAVKQYKDRGGGYKGPKTNNSLVKWTNEDWGYIDGNPRNRYLPRKIRDSLTPAERAVENRLKRASTKKGKQRAKYSKSVLGKMRSR